MESPRSQTAGPPIAKSLLLSRRRSTVCPPSTTQVTRAAGQIRADHGRAAPGGRLESYAEQQRVRVLIELPQIIFDPSVAVLARHFRDVNGGLQSLVEPEVPLRGLKRRIRDRVFDDNLPHRLALNLFSAGQQECKRESVSLFRG